MSSYAQRDPLINTLEGVQFDENTMRDYFLERVQEAEKVLAESLWKDLDRWHNDLNDLMPPSKFFTNASNKSCNLTSTIHRAMTPRLINEILDYAYPIDCEGDNTPEGKAMESECRKLFKWMIESNSDLQSQIWHFASNCIGYGLGFFYNPFEMEKEWKKEELDVVLIDGQPQINEDGAPIRYDEDQIIELTNQGYQVEYTTDFFESFKFKKFFPHPKCLQNKMVIFPEGYETMQEAFDNDFVAIKVYYTLNELVSLFENQSGLVNKIDLIKAKEFASTNNADKDDLKKVKNFKGKKIEFYLVWGKYDINGDVREEYVVMLLHPKSKTLVGYQEFEYDHMRCPIIAGCILPRHGQIPGIGVAEQLYDHKGYLDDARNDRVNQRRLSLYPPLISKTNSGFKKHLHKWEFGAVWQDVDFNLLQFFEMPAVNNHSIEDEEVVRSEADKISSLSETAYGQESSVQQTFREIIQRLDEGSKSRGMYKKWLCVPIQELFYQIFMLCRQFIGQNRDDPEVQMFVQELLDNGQKYLTQTTLDCLNYRLKIIVTATNDEKKDRLVRAKTKWEMLSSDQNIMQSPVHYRKLVIDVLRAMGEPDPENDYPTPEEMEQLIQQREMEVQRKIMAENEEAQKQQMFEAEKNKEKGRQEVIEAIDPGGEPSTEEMENSNG